MIVPCLSSTQLPGRLKQLDIECEAEGTSAYRYEHDDWSAFVVLSPLRVPWRCGPWSSDAELFFARMGAEITDQLALCTASFVNFEDKRVFLSPERIERFEWVREGKRIFSSRESAAEFFDENVLRSDLPRPRSPHKVPTP